MIIKKCPTCVYRAKGQTQTGYICSLSHREISDESYCEKHSYNPTLCEICNRIIPKGVGWILQNKNKEYIIVCDDCFYSLHTCRSCVYGSKCGVQSDTSGRPKQVQQQIQQGNMTMVTTVINPDLIKEYCPKCKCYYEGQCAKEYSMCNNYETVFPL